MKTSHKLISLALLTALSTQVHSAQRPPVATDTRKFTTCTDEPNCQSVSVEQIDLLLFYDPKEASKYRGSPETYFRGWVNQINDMYQNSGVGLHLNLVGIEGYDVSSGANTKAKQLSNLQSNQYVKKRRNELDADFVTLIKGGSSSNSSTISCGLAPVLTRYSDNAYSVVNSRCGALTLAHEMGHNMGLKHSRKQGDTSGSIYRYGLGHGVRSKFATIMAYPQDFGVGDSIGRFSNPNLHCAGFACGIPAGEADEADAVRALNNERRRFSRFRGFNANNYSNRSANIDSTVMYSFKAAHSNQCLTDGTQTEQHTCQQNQQQSWYVQSVQDDVFNIMNNKGQCLSLKNNQNYNGTQIVTEHCDGSKQQQWQVTADNNLYKIKSVATGRYLEVQGASQSNGAAIDQWNFYNGQNQKWILEAL